MAQLTKDHGPLRLVQLKDGKQTVEIRLDALEPPNDAYHADWYESALSDRMAHFVFGKLSITKQHLVTVLDVAVPQIALGPLSETILKDRDEKADFLEGLENFAKDFSLSVGSHRSASTGLVTSVTKEHSVAANFALLGYSDNDAAVTFYRLPPTFNLARIQAEDLERVKVHPVVRIDTTASILLSLCRDIISFEKNRPEANK